MKNIVFILILLCVSGINNAESEIKYSKNTNIVFRSSHQKIDGKLDSIVSLFVKNNTLHNTKGEIYIDQIDMSSSKIYIANGDISRLFNKDKNDRHKNPIFYIKKGNNVFDVFTGAEILVQTPKSMTKVSDKKLANLCYLYKVEDNLLYFLENVFIPNY
jgi:hypothetical protein